jgi:hypothetical protein
MPLLPEHSCPRFYTCFFVAKVAMLVSLVNKMNVYHIKITINY